MEITHQEALDCFASDDLIGIGMEADAVRRTLHPENVVTYTVPQTVSLEKLPGCPIHAASSHEWDLNPQQHLLPLIETHARAGDTTICLTDASKASLPHLEETLAIIRQHFPSLRLQALSTSDILALAASSGLTLAETLTRLRSSGLDSISGDDPSSSITLESWLELHRLAHRAEITSTASLIFGLGETHEDRVHHLFAIRALQSETKGFTAFTLLSPKPSAHLEPPTAVEYLRTLAIARMVLDNIPSIESNCLAHGLKVVQMALRFGANDAGSLAASAAATKTAFTEEDLRRVIRDAGFTPVERDPLYRTLFLNN